MYKKMTQICQFKFHKEIQYIWVRKMHKNKKSHNTYIKLNK